MGRWLQQIRWWLGGFFCEIGDRELAARQFNGDRDLAEQIRLLRQQQTELTRMVTINEQHRVECDRRAAETERRLRALSADYLEALRILHGEQEPPVRLVHDG